MATGRIIKVSGPLVVAEGLAEANMYDVVRVGSQRLIGEVIEMRGDQASIQVYEETAGLGPGAAVETTGNPLAVELGPGMMTMIYDGIQRPLERLRELSGNTIARGIDVPSIDREKLWEFKPTVQVGDHIMAGDIIGTVQETEVVLHKIMAPKDTDGIVTEIKEGMFRVEDVVCTLDDGQELCMLQRWAVRNGRPYKQKLMPEAPLSSGQRVIDTLFPVAKGGTACVPGPFGSGKTVIQHQLAKWSDVDIVVYIGCGERGNEMTDVLMEFPELEDPRTGKSIMQRTILIANTSDMPVAAREASIYTGITIAEYFRDMGYDVAVIADSTSRWAEALREMSGRLEEMPGEEGYPAYLASRLAQFYERAGCVQCIASEERYGSLTAIGAVSPPGGDTSEPVSQATMRIVKVFWGLDSSLAYARHFPAINWLNSYSLYTDTLQPWFDQNIDPNWMSNRNKAMSLLQEEAELDEIVKLVGKDSLGAGEQLTLETAKMIREDFLQQNSFNEIDWYSSMDRQYLLLKLILDYDVLCRAAIAQGAEPNDLFSIPCREQIGRAKSVPEDQYTAVYAQIATDMAAQIEAATQKAGVISFD